MAEVIEHPGSAARRAALAQMYAHTAVELFAERGYRAVTVAEVAAAAGVTSRTIFRYFPTKEDLLLAPARHATGLLTDAIRALPTPDDPVAAVWNLLVDMTVQYGIGPGAFDVWYRAAADMPEAITRMRGERAAAIEDTLTERFGEWLGLDPATDVRPRVLAAALHASERSVLDFHRERGGRDDLAGLFRVAYAGVRGLTDTLERPRRQRAATSRR